jgi:hypothetical protein
MNITYRLFFAAFILLTITFRTEGQNLRIESTKEVGQIEVGSPYIGIEIHKSFPLLNRISFYYPVANSIDISEDYWKRENFRIMSVGLKTGNSKKQLLRQQVYKVSQTPYSVTFSGKEDQSQIRISYEFCFTQPAMVITYEITNSSQTEQDYEVYTRIGAVLRTSHTYNVIDKAYSEYQESGSIIRINYPFTETGNSQVFFMNAGHKPSGYTTIEEPDQKYSSLDEWWLNNDESLPGQIINKENLNKPAAAFIYNKKLSPGTSIKIIQIIGSSLIPEGKEKTNYLAEHYQKEVNEYENYILKAADKKVINTGKEDLDFTSRWSKAVLSANAHYIKGQIVPMPAQAEYNFYFTHDALLTDLAAVNFDLKRVKNDLEFIISLADTDKTIPHAFYWKDTTYKTEFAGTENWNHFWFTLLCARYLRHSGDIQFLHKLYPYLEQSIRTALKNKGDDDLMWSFRPDWWDIGNNYGPRAYMTILAVRALREFNYVSAVLQKNLSQIKSYNKLAELMNSKLSETLWDDSLNYLISYYEDGTKDRHIYMGSLLAAHFNLLDNDKNHKLVKTAEANLLDEKLGIYTLYPMDLHLLISYMKFAGNEAGDPYHYANGGIWPHGNAWYALALMKSRMNEEAYRFIKTTMSMKGIINSPNGQPALYEYRISDKSDPSVYGKIDKPQFLWAGGWYLYTLYNLFGLRENEWNISFDPFIPEEMEAAELSVKIKGVDVTVDITGHGKDVSLIIYNGKEVPSVVIPDNIKDLVRVELNTGDVKTPYIKSANALLLSPVFIKESNTLEFDLESFEGNTIELQIISPAVKDNVFINGKSINSGITESKNDNIYELNLSHISEQKKNHYSIRFK